MRVCRCKSSIISISPHLNAETSLPTIGRNTDDDAPPVFWSALRETGSGDRLGRIQTKLRRSIGPTSTRARLHDIPEERRAKLDSSNPIKRLNGEIKRRTDVVVIFPNDNAIVRLVGALLLEQNDEWAVQRAC